MVGHKRLSRLFSGNMPALFDIFDAASFRSKPLISFVDNQRDANAVKELAFKSLVSFFCGENWIVQNVFVWQNYVFTW